MHAVFVWVTPVDPQFPPWWSYMGLIEDARLQDVVTAAENTHGEGTVVSFEMPEH